MILGRSQPGSGGKRNFSFYFDLQYSGEYWEHAGDKPELASVPAQVLRGLLDQALLLMSKGSRSVCIGQVFVLRPGVSKQKATHF